MARRIIKRPIRPNPKPVNFRMDRELFKKFDVMRKKMESDQGITISQPKFSRALSNMMDSNIPLFRNNKNGVKKVKQKSRRN